MSSVNKVILVGNVGSDPEVRYLDRGTAIANFNLATTERGYTMQNGTQVPDRTEWHPIVLWRNLAEWAEKYVRKGMKLYVEGKLQTRTWEKTDKFAAKQRLLQRTSKCFTALQSTAHLLHTQKKRSKKHNCQKRPISPHWRLKIFSNRISSIGIRDSGFVNIKKRWEAISFFFLRSIRYPIANSR